MYKVFFNDRKVFLTDNFSKHFEVKYGLFYKLRDDEDLQELLNFYGKLSSIDTLYIFHHDVELLRNAFKACFNQIYAAGGLVTNKKGEFLLIYRRGKWDLPKGKLDHGENFEEAAVREVEEECGINGLKIVRPLLSTYHTYFIMRGMALKKTSWYEMVYEGMETPNPQEEEDITDVRWVQPEEVEEYLKKTYPAIRDVFKYYGL